MTTNQLELRIARLERQAARWRLIASLTLLLGGAMVFMGQVAPQRSAREITATQFTLVDGDGRATGVLGYENGSAYLELRDKNGILFRIGSALQPQRTGGSSSPSTVVTYRDHDGVLRDLTKPGPGKPQLLGR